MTISSIGNNWALYMENYKYMNIGGTTANNAAYSSPTQNVGSVQGISSDGDTFQMTGGSQQLTAGQYAPPPPPPASASNSNNNDSNAATANSQTLAEMFSKLDADGDGSVSEAEFTAARPDDVSEAMAAKLYKSFDSDSSGSLTESEYQTAMNIMPPPPPPSSSGSDKDDSGIQSIANMFSKLDTDGDGSVSQKEFLVARPDDVSEAMAAKLYKSFDSDSSGSLTKSEYQTAMNIMSGSKIG